MEEFSLGGGITETGPLCKNAQKTGEDSSNRFRKNLRGSVDCWREKIHNKKKLSKWEKFRVVRRKL